MACYHFSGDEEKLSKYLLSINSKYLIIKEKNKLFCWVE
jgi:hypothetical protein